MKAAGHDMALYAREGVFRCVRCGEELNPRMGLLGSTIAMYEATASLSPCRGERLGAVNWFEYRRPTIRELLTKGAR